MRHCRLPTNYPDFLIRHAALTTTIFSLSFIAFKIVTSGNIHAENFIKEKFASSVINIWAEKS
ncbi:GSCOCG00007290001-RA-CDS [Cotesia congregata]|nr:GSCOCG00007290001-RA-CDS [Cotesia congregata]